MFRLAVPLVVVALVAAVAATPVEAKTHTFKVTEPFSIAGTALQPGTYKLKLTDNGEAEVYQAKVKLVTARVELKPRPKRIAADSVFVDSDGSLREVRLKKQIVVFVN